ncbi:hypothetical protein RUM44_004210 [Polyplax serrata]|uniref:Uncharacterized protein n=1 Tax=Polyplax serrata TaxID=468196 RepID=A0ABR1B3R8_POLSC
MSRISRDSLEKKTPRNLLDPEAYCDSRDSLDNLCNQIAGDATLYSMFRVDPIGGPVPCPFKGPPFTFTYNRYASKGYFFYIKKVGKKAFVRVKERMKGECFWKGPGKDVRWARAEDKQVENLTHERNEDEPGEKGRKVSELNSQWTSSSFQYSNQRD